jgi:hypothetical protein
MTLSLTPTERRILAALLDPSLSLLSIIERLGISIDDLLAAASSPAVRESLESLGQLTTLRARAISAQAALTALEDISRASDDPVERRRAATTLIRASVPPSRSVPRDRSESPPSAAAPAPPPAADSTPAVFPSPLADPFDRAPAVPFAPLNLSSLPLSRAKPITRPRTATDLFSRAGLGTPSFAPT